MDMLLRVINEGKVIAVGDKRTFKKLRILQSLGLVTISDYHPYGYVATEAGRAVASKEGMA